ncbi:isoprenylcysteine carboxylmethyltransferase family protein [Terricaulis sp.]|uniref:methyltransferase family protein n=1 Tax=Terricaulis sp. TaxID=2768686 RepID=UPI002AC72C98|nr:isoprenylcysteine carboxylmethyltransferase family protein [Terricaulis sp.]MDZ4691896.1 isoprenylcysteine carboxylmethyltransferase family protein [Terricaulis sp.]
MSVTPTAAKVVAPPPVLFVGTLFFGLLIDRFVWRMSFGIPDAPRLVLGGVFVAAGVLLLFWAVAGFARAGTGVRHAAGSSALVTSGPHAFTRNPMYLAMALAYAGLALLADSLISLALLAPLLVVIQFGVIAREERFMEAKFGDAYRAYRKRVRPWI